MNTQFYRVLYEDGYKGTIIAKGIEDAWVVGRGIDPDRPIKKVYRIPYPALPRLMYLDGWPEFCNDPDGECAGKKQCPKNPVCID